MPQIKIILKLKLEADGFDRYNNIFLSKPPNNYTFKTLVSTNFAVEMVTKSVDY